MLRRAALIVSVVLLAGCAWGQPGFDGGNSSDNRAEPAVNAQTVTGLHELWKTAGGNATVPAPILSGGYLLTSTNSALVGTGTGGCPGGGVPTCAPAWHVDGSFGPPVSDGSSVFVRDTATEHLRVFDLHGNPLWTFTPTPVPNKTSALSPEIQIDSGRVWVEVHDTDMSNATTDRLISLPAGGCGASSCAAVTTIAAGNNFNAASFDEFAATDGLVFRNRRDGSTWYLQAFEAATGAEQWRSKLATDGDVFARDGWVVTSQVSGGHSSTDLVFPTHAGGSCTGAPLACSPFANFAGTGNIWLPITTHHFLTIDSIGHISGIAKDLTTGCTIAHACSPVWSGGFNGLPGTGPISVAGGLIYAAKVNGIAAFSDDGSTGCNTTTITTCSALWSTTLADRALAIAIAGGRLYIAEADGFIHVYGL